MQHGLRSLGNEKSCRNFSSNNADIRKTKIIHLSGVKKSFGGFAALKGITASFARGERAVICGPSGSGKSTLIRCVNGLERHDSGTVMVDGKLLDHDRRRRDQIRRSAGMVFQQFNLFPHLTVLQNCTLAPIRVRGLSRAEAEALALSYLERVHIPEQAHKFPAQLSGGQQQRVAIARSLCMAPRIMLFDEPTSALDPEMIKEVLDVIVELADEGMTMLIVTHEMGFARRVAHRILFMAEGEILEDAAPDSFFAAPRTPRARQFLSRLLGH